MSASASAALRDRSETHRPFILSILLEVVRSGLRGKVRQCARFSNICVEPYAWLSNVLGTSLRSRLLKPTTAILTLPCARGWNVIEKRHSYRSSTTIPLVPTRGIGGRVWYKSYHVHYRHTTVVMTVVTLVMTAHITDVFSRHPLFSRPSVFGVYCAFVQVAHFKYGNAICSSGGVTSYLLHQADFCPRSSSRPPTNCIM